MHRTQLKVLILVNLSGPGHLSFSTKLQCNLNVRSPWCSTAIHEEDSRMLKDVETLNSFSWGKLVL
jgi:hypothetical protein